MKTVVRLLQICFTATPLSRWLTLASASVVLVSFGALGWILVQPEDPSWAAIVSRNAHAAVWIVAMFAGLCGLVLASALMPMLLGHHALGRQLSVLPRGNMKLLTSALVLVMLLALPGAALLPLALSIVGPGTDPLMLFVRSYALGCLNLTLLYIAYWTAATRRTAGGRLAGAMIVVAVIIGPSGGLFLYEPEASIAAPVFVLFGLWSFIAALLLNWRSIRQRASDWASRRRKRDSRSMDPARRIDILLGTARPWRLALVQIFPVIVATHFVRAPEIWLFYLTLVG